MKKEDPKGEIKIKPHKCFAGERYAGVLTIDVPPYFDAGGGVEYAAIIGEILCKVKQTKMISFSSSRGM